MSQSEFNRTRLYVRSPISSEAIIPLDRGQANYLLNVLRLKSRDEISIFNGVDGEWRACVESSGRKKASLVAVEQTLPQPEPNDLQYVFAPLKQARQEYMVQKAVELGASALVPVLTEFTQVRKINKERMLANGIEAAEQCEILTLPEIHPLASLDDYLAKLDAKRHVIFCDESASAGSPLEQLKLIPVGPLAVLIGPEGGFSKNERDVLLDNPQVHAISLGPRILRADTAAVAALAVVQMILGDWNK